MKVIKVTEPFEHLIVEDVYTMEEEQRIWRELDFLTDKLIDNNDGSSTAKDKDGNRIINIILNAWCWYITNC